MMKRICALLLALSCMLSAAAGAVFTDEAQITETEAVHMLATMGILPGNADGSYGPNTTVTRGEMAKMLYMLCLDTSDATAYKDIPTSYTDISGHWAAGYIKYCEISGLLAGYPAGKFYPDARITGTETLRMLLLVMGYSPTRTGLSGSGWQSVAMGLASDKGLLDGVDYDMAAALPRQYAAQLLCNALDADYVQWSSETASYEAVTVNGKAQTVGTKYLKLGSSIGTLVKQSRDSITIVQNSADVAESTNTFTSFGKVPEDITALLGHRIRVLTKNGKVNQVLGAFETEGGSCVTVNRTDISQSSSDIKVDDKKYALSASGVKIYEDGDYTAQYTAASSFVSTQSPDQMILVDSNNDGKLELALILPYLVTTVTTVSKKSIKAGGTTYTFADNNIQSGLAVKDYVLITHNGYKSQYDIVKATFRTGTVDAVKGSADPYDQYKIDGTWYTRAADNYEMNAIKGGENVQYLIVNHVVFCTRAQSDVTSTVFSNVAMVLGLDTSLAGNQAKLLFMDGTTKTVTAADSEELPFSSLVRGNFYELSTDTKGQYYFNKLSTSEGYYSNYTAVDNTLISGWSNATPSGGKPVSKSSYNGVTLASSAQIILYYAPSNKYAFVGASQFERLCAATGSVINTSGGLAGFMKTAQTKKEKDTVYLMAVAVSKMPDLTEDHYGYLVKDSVLTSKNTLTYTFWDGSVYRTVLEQIGGTKLTAKDRRCGMVVGYSDIETDGTITDPVIYATEGDGIYIRPLAAVSGDTLTYTLQGTPRSFTKSSSTKVLYVDSNAGAADQIGKGTGAIQVAAVKNNGYLLPNTMLIPGGADGVALLVVDVANQLDVPGMYVTVSTKKVTNGKTKAAITGGTSVKMGDRLTLTLTDTKGADKTVTLQNAVFADTGSATRTVTLAAKTPYACTILADGGGTVNLTMA